MSSQKARAEVLRSEDAMEILQNEDDPITRALLANANFWFMKKFFEQGQRPVADYDYAFFMEVLRAMLSEHDVLKRILNGENVGEFFDDHEPAKKSRVARISDAAKKRTQSTTSVRARRKVR